MIQLKGRQAGLLQCIVPADMSERQIFEGFSSLLSSGSHLLSGSEVVIDLQTRRFSPALLSKIWKNFIEPSGCIVTKWIVEDPQSRSSLERMGLKTSDGERPQPKREVHEEVREEKVEVTAPESVMYPGFVYFGTLRGGQNIGHAGDVIIIGNVNQGAEVAAQGNITVIGRLNGIVHAGCNGNDEMTVVTRHLEAGQVRIGTKIGLIDRDSPFWGKPVTIRIFENEVLVAPWPEL